MRAIHKFQDFAGLREKAVGQAAAKKVCLEALPPIYCLAQEDPTEHTKYDRSACTPRSFGRQILFDEIIRGGQRLASSRAA
jgi:hypothetical protein